MCDNEKSVSKIIYNTFNSWKYQQSNVHMSSGEKRVLLMQYVLLDSQEK